MCDSKKTNCSGIFSEAQQHISRLWGLELIILTAYIMSQTLPKGSECPFAKRHLPRMADCIKFHLQNIYPLNRLPESPKRPIKSLAITAAPQQPLLLLNRLCSLLFTEGSKKSKIQLSRVTMHSQKRSWVQKESITLSLIWEETKCSLSFTSLTILQNYVLRTAWIPFMAPGISLTPIVYDCSKAEL